MVEPLSKREIVMIACRRAKNHSVAVARKERALIICHHAKGDDREIQTDLKSMRRLAKRSQDEVDKIARENVS